MNPTLKALQRWHAGRDPFLLGLKRQKMAESPLAFFRGTAPLFYDYWTDQRLPPAPRAWICGDVHLENIGSYLGENGVAYFDLNDFDESCRAPVHWDLGRALTGLEIAGHAALAPEFLAVYLATLARGKPMHIEPEVAEGTVAKLLAAVRDRKRKQFLKHRLQGGHLAIVPGRTYALVPKVRTRALGIYRRWAAAKRPRTFFMPLDICGRIAGNGSLGVERYVVLVRGRRQPHLIDMKQAAPRAAAGHLPPQPAWSCEAERVVATQTYLQYVPAAHLGWTAAENTSYVLRELQPLDDRINEDELSPDDYRSLIEVWAKLVASAHLRTSGWKNAATLDELMAFGRNLTRRHHRQLLAATKRTADKVKKAHTDFVRFSAAAKGSGH